MLRAGSALIGLIVLATAVPARAETASVKAEFQPIVDGAITVDEAVLPSDGFLVVRLPKQNKVFYGDVLATVPLKAGRHSKIAVKLQPGAKVGDTLGIILHRDDTTTGTYEFEIGKKADLPFFSGRRPVMTVIGVID